MSKRASKRAADNLSARQLDFDRLPTSERSSRRRPGSLNPRKGGGIARLKANR
jgi:hypothetical protein